MIFSSRPARRRWFFLTSCGSNVPRPLEAVYPIVYLDALVIKIRDGQAVRNFACYLAIGGTRSVARAAQARSGTGSPRAWAPSRSMR